MLCLICRFAKLESSAYNSALVALSLYALLRLFDRAQRVEAAQPDRQRGPVVRRRLAVGHAADGQLARLRPVAKRRFDLAAFLAVAGPALLVLLFLVDVVILDAIPSLLVGIDHGRELALDLRRLAAAREKPLHTTLGGGRRERLVEAVCLLE